MVSSQDLDGGAKRVHVIQLIIGGLVAVGFYVFTTPWLALSAAVGTVISVIPAYWLGRGVAAASRSVEQGGKKGEIILYASAALRFLLILLLFVLSLALLKLDALATVVGFIFAQLAFAISAIFFKQESR